MGLLVPMVILFMTASTAAAPDCLEYEPRIVQIRGTVERETFPGPPNYSDVKQGDKPERVWILKLLKPMCVNAKPSDDLYPAAASVTRVQLVLDPGQYERFASLVDRKVEVWGKLFSAHTGHHHTDVLVTVQKMKPLGQV